MSAAGSLPRLAKALLLVGLLIAAGTAGAQRGPPAPGGSGVQAKWSGWAQVDSAYAWHEPSHLANMRTRGEVVGRGGWEGGAKWKLSARASYDGAYDGSDHFPPGVRSDQRSELRLHEAYVDFSRGGWEFRLGKQNIVWGEMVGSVLRRRRVGQGSARIHPARVRSDPDPPVGRARGMVRRRPAPRGHLAS